MNLYLILELVIFKVIYFFRFSFELSSLFFKVEVGKIHNNLFKVRICLKQESKVFYSKYKNVWNQIVKKRNKGCETYVTCFAVMMDGRKYLLRHYKAAALLLVSFVKFWPEEIALLQFIKL